ncbi:MAG: hypothetical protein AB1805_00555 [Nitrospirota bacterium]
MKTIVSFILVAVLACGFLFMGSAEAEAMNNESAAMLAGAIAIFGKPMLQAVVREISPAQPAYAASYPSYTETREIIYVTDDRPHHKHYRHRNKAYERGWRDEWRERAYERGRADARKRYRHHDCDD